MQGGGTNLPLPISVRLDRSASRAPYSAATWVTSYPRCTSAASRPPCTDVRAGSTRGRESPCALRGTPGRVCPADRCAGAGSDNPSREQGFARSPLESCLCPSPAPSCSDAGRASRDRLSSRCQWSPASPAAAHLPSVALLGAAGDALAHVRNEPRPACGILAQMFPVRHQHPPQNPSFGPCFPVNCW